MQIIPIIAAPSQTLSVVLGGQSCQISLYSLQTAGDIFVPVGSMYNAGSNITADSDVTADAGGNLYSTVELQGYPALYCDVSANGASIINARIVRNLIPMLLSSKYQPFIGDLVMIDTLSDTNPVWTGLGTQYQFVYLQASDLPT